MKYIILSFIILLIFSASLAQKTKGDSLKISIKNATVESEKIALFEELCRFQIEKTASEVQATAYDALALSKSKGSKNNIALFYRILGTSFEKMGEFERAEMLADSAAMYIEKNEKGKVIEAENEVLLGTINRRKAKYDVAIGHFLKAEVIASSSNDLKVYCSTLMQLGVCNVSIKNYNKAKEYHTKAIEIAKKINDNRRISVSYGNIGIIHRELEEYTLANKYFEDALKYALASSDSATIAFVYSESGNIKAHINELKTARKYLMNALGIKERFKEYNTIPYIYFYLANLEGTEGNVEAGKIWIKKALELAMKMKSDKQILDCYNSYHYLYMKAGMYDSALVNYKKYKELDATASSENIKTKIEELNIKYETQKKDIQIKKQQLTNSYYVVGLISLLSLLGLGYVFYKRNQFNQKVQMQLAIANEQLKSNRAVTKAEEVERRRISRDLHDNMGAYTSALIANVQQLKSVSGENEHTSKMQTNAESILNSLRETIWILNNKEINLNDFNDGFKNYCFKVLRNFEDIDFDVNESISNNPVLTATQAIHLNKILQEIIQNSIKHANCSKIIYSINDHDGLLISLSDNGDGFNHSNNLGFGLENMQWRAKESNLKISIESEKNKGTTVKINTL